MNSRQLSHLVAVAEYSSFTSASKALNIAQPALSISIKKFESLLGVNLFLRSDRKIELTAEGKILYEHAKKVQQQIDDAQLAINELIGLEKGEVRLGAPSMVGSYIFPEILMAFKSHYPNLKLVLIDAGASSIKQMLLSGELDIGVIIEQDVPDDLEVDHLMSAQMVAVVGDNHTFAERQTLPIESFLAEELVMFKPGYFHRDLIDDVSQRLGKELRLAFETNLVAMILNIVRREFAISVLLDFVPEQESGVVGIPFEQGIHLDLALAWRKNGYQSKADKTFIDFVKRYV